MFRHPRSAFLPFATCLSLAAHAANAQATNQALAPNVPAVEARGDVPSHTTLHLSGANLTIETRAGTLLFEARNTVDRVQTVFLAGDVAAWAQTAAQLLDHERARALGEHVLGDIGGGRRTEFRSPPLTSADSTSLVLGRIERVSDVVFDIYVASADGRHTVYSRLTPGAAEQLLSALSRAAFGAPTVAGQ